jgi:hypothetical protein
MESGNIFKDFILNFFAFIMMILMAILSFFFTVFVVDFGASLAGYPKDTYTVLSAAILVAASIIAGGISPLGYMSQSHHPSRNDDKATTD